MTFRADFWVVTGTAAPIIALSVILVNGDLLQIDLDLSRVTGKEPGDIPVREWPSEYFAMVLWYMVTFVITLFQAATLLLSLMSLAQEHNYVSTKLIGATESLSLVVLGLATLNLIRLKALVRHIEEVHYPSRRSAISSHPFRKPQSNMYKRANRYRSSHQVANARRARRGPQLRNRDALS